MSLLMRAVFKIFDIFREISRPRVLGKSLSESRVPGKSRSRKVARPKRPPGKSRARRVGFSRKFAAPSSQKVVFPESRVRGKSLNEAPWIATLLRGFERGPASPESRKSTSRVLPESRAPGKSLNEPPETCLMKSSTATVLRGFPMGYFLSFSSIFLGFSQFFLWRFVFSPGLLKFFPAPSSRKVVLPLIGGERALRRS